MRFRRYAEPRDVLRRWLPHLLMLSAIVASIWLVALVVAPLFEPILMAAALAMLTAPILNEPVYQWLRRRSFPAWTGSERLPEAIRLKPPLAVSDGLARRIAGITATALLATLLLTPIIVVLISAAHSIEDMLNLVVGIVTGKTAQLDRLESMIRVQVVEVHRLYPRLDLNPSEIAGGIRNLLGEALGVTTAFIAFVVKGTSAAAQLALAIISLAFFYVEGPGLARTLLQYSPLHQVQQETLLAHHRATVLRLLTDTVASAIAKGLILGGIVWGFDRLFGTGLMPFFPIAIVAGVITLLPLVGVTIVWLPIATLMFQTQPVGAVLLAVLCWSANFAIEHFREMIGRRIDDRSSWRSFLLFLGLVGGLISYGTKGLVIGPMAVVLVSTVCSAWLPLYGATEDATATAEGDTPPTPIDPPQLGDTHRPSEPDA